MITTGGSFRLYGPDYSMISDNNDFGLALNMTLPLLLLLAHTESKLWVRKFFAFAFICTIPAVFFTYSRGALFGMSVVAIFMLVTTKQRWMLIPTIAFAIYIAVSLAPDQWKQRMDPSRTDAVDISARQRLNAWNYSWALASDYPITGAGFEAFTPELYQRYAPEVNWVHGPHSIYFGVLAEHGFVGLTLYLFLVVSCIATTWRVARLARRYGDTVAAEYAIMLRLSVFGFLASGVFLGRAYFDYYFTIVACIAILHSVCISEWSRPSAGDSGHEEYLEAAHA
jgi:probable O-glycosylation ligase (exosortase A-associated)